MKDGTNSDKLKCILRQHLELNINTPISITFDKFAILNITNIMNCHHTAVLLLQRMEILQKISTSISPGVYQIKLSNHSGKYFYLQN